MAATNGKKITDEEIMKAVQKHGNAEKVMEVLNIKYLATLQVRIGRISAERGELIQLDGLYPDRKKGGGGQRKDPKVHKDGSLYLGPAWMKDSGFAEGDTFDVKFSTNRITLTKKS